MIPFRCNASEFFLLGLVWWHDSIMDMFMQVQVGFQWTSGIVFLATALDYGHSKQRFRKLSCASKRIHEQTPVSIPGLYPAYAPYDFAIIGEDLV